VGDHWTEILAEIWLAILHLNALSTQRSGDNTQPTPDKCNTKSTDINVTNFNQSAFPPSPRWMFGASTWQQPQQSKCLHYCSRAQVSLRDEAKA